MSIDSAPRRRRSLILVFVLTSALLALWLTFRSSDTAQPSSSGLSEADVQGQSGSDALGANERPHLHGLRRSESDGTFNESEGSSSEVPRRVYGTVKDEKGRPVSGARIVVDSHWSHGSTSPLGEHLMGPPTLTDREGNYSFDLKSIDLTTPRIEWIEVRAIAPGHSCQSRMFVVSLVPRQFECDLEAKEGGFAVRGRLLDHDGRPMRNARFFIVELPRLPNEDGDHVVWDELGRLRPDGSGRFEYTVDGAGTYAIVYKVHGQSWRVWHFHPFVLSEEHVGVHDLGDIRRSEARSLDVSVYACGEQVDAKIWATFAKAETTVGSSEHARDVVLSGGHWCPYPHRFVGRKEADKGWQLYPLRDVAYVIGVGGPLVHPDIVTDRVASPPHSGEMVIQLDGAMIQLRWEQDARDWLRPRVWLNAGGVWELVASNDADLLVPANAKVQLGVEYKEDERVVHEIQSPGPGQRLEWNVPRPPPAGSATIRVINAKGEPLDAELEVSWESAEYQCERTYRVDEDQPEIRVDRLPSGSYSVRARNLERQGYFVDEWAEFEVTDGEHTNVVMTMKLGGRVQFEMAPASPEAIPRVGISLSAHSSSWLDKSEYSIPKRRLWWTSSPGPVDRYTATLLVDGSRKITREVVVKKGETTVVRVELAVGIGK